MRVVKRLFLVVIALVLIFTVSCSNISGNQTGKNSDNSKSEDVVNDNPTGDEKDNNDSADKQPSGEDKTVTPDDTGKPAEEENKDIDNTVDSSENGDKTNEDGKDANTEDNTQPNQGNTGKGSNSGGQGNPGNTSLDVETLNKLNNTTLSWWFKMNKEKGTSEVPDDIRAMIDKYDAYYIGDTSEKVVYLTFDEGYENGYTASILDTLKANDVKAMFFVTGHYVNTNPDLVQRMIDEGHKVENHTINHPSLPSISYEQLEKEIKGFDEEFKKKFGVGFTYMRPPSGEYSERVLAATQQLGYKTVFWSFAYKDWDVNDQKGADYAYNMVMNNLHNGAVYLLHAVSRDNTEALDRIIKGIREAGYEIRLVDF